MEQHNYPREIHLFAGNLNCRSNRYIVDFVCYEAKLIIELDGSHHIENKSHDENKDCWLQEQGFRVLRFWNDQLTKQTREVMDEIWNALQNVKTPSPQPSPIKGEGADLSSEGKKI